MRAAIADGTPQLILRQMCTFAQIDEQFAKGLKGLQRFGGTLLSHILNYIQSFDTKSHLLQREVCYNQTSIATPV